MTIRPVLTSSTARVDFAGVARLSVTPLSPLVAISVGDNDPRLSDATPLSIRGNNTATPAYPFDLTPAQVVTMLPDAGTANRGVTQLGNSYTASSESLAASSKAIVDAMAYVAANFEPSLGNPAVDNYVLASSATGLRGWVAQSGGTAGGVTSVGIAMPNDVFTVSGSPVTSSGTPAVSFLAQAPNTFLRGPSSGTPSGTPIFGPLVAADIPGSTVGKAVLALANPGAISFPRFNVDNTVTALSAPDFRTAIGAGTSSFDGAYTSLSGIPSTFAPSAHVLNSATHTVSGLTTGHFLKALSATTFGFAAHGLTYSDVGALASGGTAANSSLLEGHAASYFQAAIGYTAAKAIEVLSDAHSALAVGPRVLTGLSHGVGSSNYATTYGCGMGLDNAAYTSSSCLGSWRLDSPLSPGNKDFYLDKLVTYTDPSTQVWTGPMKIWTDGNDGAGSGLDADTLDGNHASAFALTAQTMYIGTTAVAINRASGALTLAGMTFTTPNIGAATGTSLALGTAGTTNYMTINSAGIGIIGSTSNSWESGFKYKNTSGTVIGAYGVKTTPSGGEPTLDYMWIGPTWNDETWATRLYSSGIVRIYGLTASRAVLTDAWKNLVSSTITSAQLEAISSGRGTVVSTNPSDPTGTSSGTEKMMGLAVSFAPAYGTRAMVVITGERLVDTAGSGITVRGRYGTGSAPTNGASVTGTQFGPTVNTVAAAGGFRYDFCIHAVLTGLTVGTTYWFDLGLLRAVAGTAALINLSVSIVEC